MQKHSLRRWEEKWTSGLISFHVFSLFPWPRKPSLSLQCGSPPLLKGKWPGRPCDSCHACLPPHVSPLTFSKHRASAPAPLLLFLSALCNSLSFFPSYFPQLWDLRGAGAASNSQQCLPRAPLKLDLAGEDARWHLLNWTTQRDMWHTVPLVMGFHELEFHKKNVFTWLGQAGRANSMWNEKYIAKLFGLFSHLRKGLSGNLQRSRACSLGKHSQQPDLISPGDDPECSLRCLCKGGILPAFLFCSFWNTSFSTFHSHDQSNHGLTMWLWPIIDNCFFSTGLMLWHPQAEAFGRETVCLLEAWVLHTMNQELLAQGGWGWG